MSLLLLLRPSKESGAAPNPPPPWITDKHGWYVYGPNDPKPTWKSTRGKKHVTREEWDVIKHFKKKEEQELILIHLRHGEYDWSDDYDD